MSVEFIFSEFGDRSRTHHFHTLKKYGEKYRLDPTYSSIKQFFPDAKITVYTDREHIADVYPDVEIRKIDMDACPFSGLERCSNYCNDYYQADGLLKSKSDVAVSVDCDIMFVSDNIKTLLPITKKFGFCIPQNPRQLVKKDGVNGKDGNYEIGEDESLGNILTYDLWWMSLYTKSKNGRIFYENFMKSISDKPARGPLHLTRTAWNTGIYPYAMPIQWAVSEHHVGCKHEIIVNMDSFKAQDYYLEERMG